MLNRGNERWCFFNDCRTRGYCGYPAAVQPKLVWWIRFFDFPRAQIALIGAVALAADLAFSDAGRSDRAVGPRRIGLCILYQAYEIRPYTIFSRERSAAGEEPTP